MDSPLAPKPVTPGLRPPQVVKAGRDRKRKGRSFQDELGEPQDEAPEPRPASPRPPDGDAVPAPSKEEPGHLLDVEA